MSPYSSYAQFYDEIEGQPTERAQIVTRAISRFLLGATSLLELGRGTGSVLALLGQVPNRSGIDISPEMLEVARVRLPGVRLIEGDIAAFDLDERFGVIICVYDTINHLLDFDSWVSLFAQVRKHFRQEAFLFSTSIPRVAWRLSAKRNLWFVTSREHSHYECHVPRFGDVRMGSGVLH
ncbi:MAG: class I SAM-dependent methyltransferase [Acidimicrobiales bacterium]